MPQSLVRSMRFRHALAMVVGIILGASVFIQASEITRLVPRTRMVMLAWLAAGVLTFCGALVCAELSAAFPQTGGVYVFLRRIFSPALGFLWGWAMFWSIHSGIIAAIAVVLARYVAYFVPAGETTIRLLAIAAIALLSAVNYLGVRFGSAVQLALTSAKVAAIILMVILLFCFGSGAHHALPVNIAIPRNSIAAFGLAIAAGLFAFGGWHMVTYSSGETLDAKRTIPRALLWGTLIVTMCYMLLNASYYYVLPLHEVAQSTHVAADAVERVLGMRGAGGIAMLVVLSALGGLNGIILAGPRVYYAMAQDGLAFRWLGAVHPSRQTPYLAIAAQAGWSCVLVATNSYRALFGRVVYTEWLFFALLAAGLLVLRRRTDYQAFILKRGYQPVAVVFILAAVSIAVNQCIADPWDSAAGLGLLILGLPVYFLWARKNRVIRRSGDPAI
jgi:basic amino acid/polyamine antiporter, APA family